MLVKNFFRQNPLLRIIIPFAIGIYCVSSNSKYFNTYYSSILIIIFLTYVISVIYLTKFYKYKHKWINGFLVVVFFYTTAYLLTSLTFENQCYNHFSYNKSENEILIVEIKNTKKSGNSIIKAEADVLFKNINKEWQKIRGRILLNFKIRDTACSNQIIYGSRFIICCNYNEIKAAANPGDFNYKNYLAQKRIFHQARLNADNYLFIGENSGSLRRLTQKIRDNLLNIFASFDIKGQEYAVSSALVFGYSDEIDNDTRRQYSSAGAMHILCVSGMHVGVVYLVINFIISLIIPLKKKTKTKAVLQILSIWFYALLTGLAPSVFRATAMLSFVIIGTSLSRKTSIYNTLCASALLILISDPQLIKNIGFQLSYIAVLGIVILYEPIRKLWFPKYKLFQKIWELIAVSIAAQIATGPLAMLYFNQFPNYFILTNLIAAPLSGFIIYLAIATIITSPLEFAGAIFAKALNFLVTILNNSLAFIENLPYSVTKGININFLQCLIIYGIIISLYLTIKNKQKIYLWSSLVLILCLSVFSFAKDINTSNKKLFVIFNNYKGSSMGFYVGKKSLILADTNIINKNKNSSMQAAWEKVYEGINKTIVIPWQNEYINFYNKNFIKEDNFIKYYDKNIFIIDKYFYLKNNNHLKFDVDYIFIKKSQKMNKAKDILNLIKPQIVIVDANVPYWTANDWKKQCVDNNINFHYIKDDGAFVGEINNF